MFHLLLPISWGSCCFSDCGGAVSVSAITNETVPIFLFFFLLSHRGSLHFIMQAAWRYLTECAICNPQLQSPLSLSSHRWQLNPTAACHGEAGKKWWCCCCLKREWGERKTDPKAPMWMSVFWHHKSFAVWHGFGTAAFQVSVEWTLNIWNSIIIFKRGRI